MRLLDSGREALLLCARLNQITDMLESYQQTAIEIAPLDQKTAKAVQKTVAEVILPDTDTVVDQAESGTLQKGCSPGMPIASVENQAVSVGPEQAVPISPVLDDFLITKDPSRKARQLVETCARKLSGLCGKRITLSLHKPYICFWDYDEWKTFAFGEIIDGVFYLSIDKSLIPDSDSADNWIPPGGLYKKPLVRLKVEAVTDGLLAQLKSTLAQTVGSVA